MTSPSSRNVPASLPMAGETTVRDRIGTALVNVRAALGKSAMSAQVPQRSDDLKFLSARWVRPASPSSECDPIETEGHYPCLD
jgi:hypothetical protein